EEFYGQLATGITKDEALRAAKLSYLSKANTSQEAHPYFWAPFVVIGDVAPVTFYQGNTRWWWLVGLLLGLMGIGYFVKRRQAD
ncbi:MAG: CHAT domain-containing protein, partial [Bacteroidota bacterium]